MSLALIIIIIKRKKKKKGASHLIKNENFSSKKNKKINKNENELED